MTKINKVVISLGGSLVVPQGGIAVDFLSKFNNLIRKQLEKTPDSQFFIVVGGGSTARNYIAGGRAVIGHQLLDEDLDWLGIHTTRLNAHLIRTIFRDIAHTKLIKHYEIIRRVEERVVIAAGWKPGWSTDFCNTLICEDYNIGTIINLSNIDVVYDKDPRTHASAKPMKNIKWKDFRKLVGDKWTPGMSAPFDPIASKKAQELGLKVIVMKGDNFKNLENYFAGKKFIGTVIENQLCVFPYTSLTELLKHVISNL